MAAAGAMVGCETFYPPVNFVPVKGRLTADQPMGVMESNSNRRFVYVVRRSPTEPGAETKAPVFVYAEPPPDTALQSAVKIAASLPNSVSGSAEVAQQIIQLTNRTQRIVLMRDTMFRLIEARANGVLTDDQYNTLFQTVFTGILKLADGSADAKQDVAQAAAKIGSTINDAAKPDKGGIRPQSIDPKLFESYQQTLDALKMLGGDGTGPR